PGPAGAGRGDDLRVVGRQDQPVDDRGAGRVDRTLQQASAAQQGEVLARQALRTATGGDQAEHLSAHSSSPSNAPANWVLARSKSGGRPISIQYSWIGKAPTSSPSAARAPSRSGMS